MTSALKPHAHVFVCNAVNVILSVSLYSIWHVGCSWQIQLLSSMTLFALYFCGIPFFTSDSISFR